MYPFAGERKFGAVRIRPAHIIVTSNKTIDECFASFDDVHRRAIRRRFKEVNLFLCSSRDGRFCRCFHHHPELYPLETCRRFVQETQGWFEEAVEDGKFNVDYPESHPIWRPAAAVSVSELTGVEITKRPRVVMPPANPEDVSQASLPSQGEAAVGLRLLSLTSRPSSPNLAGDEENPPN